MVLNYGPEVGGVVRLKQVGQFVDDDVIRFADNSDNPQPSQHGWYHQVTSRTTPSGNVIGVEEGKFWCGSEATSYWM